MVWTPNTNYINQSINQPINQPKDYIHVALLIEFKQKYNNSSLPAHIDTQQNNNNRNSGNSHKAQNSAAGETPKEDKQSHSKR